MAEMKEINPANKAGKTKEEVRRIPMSSPVQKLQVADIPGYHLHWMRNAPDRVAQAQRAGYEFVRPEEIHVNSVGLGTQSAVSGNTDLGSLVSVIAGGELGPDNQPVRLVLMKLKQEYWEEDQKKVEERNDQVAAALNGGQIGAREAKDGSELNMRYVGSRTKLPDMFTKKIRK